MEAFRRLMVEGGWPMWFTLAFGVATLTGAARFAWTADRERVPGVIALGAATLFSTVTGTAADFAAVGHAFFERWDRLSPDLVRNLLQGVAESMSPAILGCTFLSVASVLCAAGYARARVTSGAARAA